MLKSGGESDVDVHHRRKKAVKRKGPKPEYGRIRDVNDIYDSDPETAPLRAHRDLCERCRRQPAHILMKSKKKGRRKSVEDPMEEEEDFSSLGGWVRWCVFYCVPFIASN